MTLNWEGGFQYGGACTADGLAAAFAQFPQLPAVAHWRSVLDMALDGYMLPASTSSPRMAPCGTHFPYGYVRRLSTCRWSQGDHIVVRCPSGRRLRALCA